MSTITISETKKATALQLVTIFICFLMNVFDGVDVSTISYALPKIAKEWSVEPKILGGVLSAALLGMAIGALFIAPIADIIGRRKVILFSTLFMGITVYTTSWASNVWELSVLRFLSGLGVGSILAGTATMATEFAPKKTKGFWISIVMGGYPIGAVLAGLAAVVFIKEDWRIMFQYAGIATLITVPFLYFYLVESVDFLLKRQPKNALSQTNSILEKINEPTLTSLPVQEGKKESVLITSLLKGERLKPTLLLWISFFMTFGTMYFLVSWIPKLGANAGLNPTQSIYAGAVLNFGAFIGITLLGYLSDRFGLKKIIIYFLIGTAILMGIFSYFMGTPAMWLIFGLIGFGIQGSIVGYYGASARLYPTEIRSTGVGAAIGMGRFGAIAAPIFAGYLVAANLTMAQTFWVFAIPVLLAIVATLMIKESDFR